MKPALLAVAALLPAVALAQAPERDELAALAHKLETAAARVSVTSPGFLGSSAARAYRIPGVGAVVVLAPRVLAPAAAPSRVLLPLTPAPPATRTAASRAELERAILELRASLERASGPLTAARTATDSDLRALERDAEQRLAAAARARAEAFRALADAMAAMPDMPRVTLGPAFAPPPHGGRRVLLPLAAPSPRPEDDTLTRVHSAMREVLPEASALASSLPDHESVSVAVDFMAPGSWPGTPPRRTLVVRARMGDLRAAARAVPAPPGPRQDLDLEVVEY